MSAWVGQYEPLTFMFVDQSSPNFFHPTCNGMKYFSDLRYIDPFRRYSRSKSKIVWNCADFWPFFASQISGGKPSKSYTHFITPTSRHVAWKMFCEDTSTSLEVIGAHTLNFKPNYKFSRLKYFGGTLPVRVCASKASSICRVCKKFKAQNPLRAEI